MASVVEILISPAYHIINIIAVSVFIARPRQVNFKQTTLQQMSSCSICKRKNLFPFVEYLSVHKTPSCLVDTQGRHHLPLFYR